MPPWPIALSIDVRHLRKVVRRDRRGRRSDLLRAARRGARAAGRQWRRQDHDHRHAARAARADGGRDQRAGRRHAEAALRRPAAHELLLALCRPAASPDRAPEPAVLRPALRREEPRAAHRGDRRAHADRAVPRPPVGQAVGRPEDAGGARQGADQPARGAAARRADGLARSRHRRLGARLPRGLPARDPRHDHARPRTT